jgi:hypothetical protein
MVAVLLLDFAVVAAVLVVSGKPVQVAQTVMVVLDYLQVLRGHR